MTETMRNFLSMYLVFAEFACYKHGDIFDRHSGLCSNAMDFVARRGNAYGECSFSARRELRNELRRMFEDDGLDLGYPFGEEDYDLHVKGGKHHLHQPRIDWIKEKLNAVQN